MITAVTTKETLKRIEIGRSVVVLLCGKKKKKKCGVYVYALQPLYFLLHSPCVSTHFSKNDNTERFLP